MNISQVQQFLPALSQGLSFHHALCASSGQWQLQVSHCTECPFSLGGQPILPVSCDEHLPPSAYGCIPLHHSGLLCIFLHPSVSLCVPLHIWVARARCQASEQAPAPPAPPIGKQSNLREQGLLPQIRGCVCSVCSQAIHAVCPNMYF